MARPLRRVGVAEVPARRASTSRWSGWASTTSTSSTATGSTRRRRWRRRWARWTTRSGRARRSTPASRPTPRSTRSRPRAILREMGTPLLIHQPSYSMLNRWIEGGPARRPGGGGRRLHRVLPAGAGHADRPLPRRHPRGLAGRPGRVLTPEHAHRRDAARTSARSTGSRASGPVARADGAGLGAARPAGHLGADRREQRRAAGGQPRARWRTCRSPPTSWTRSTGTRSRRASTSGPRPARRNPPPPPFEEKPPPDP